MAKRKNIINTIWESIICFFVALIATSPLVGTCFAFFNLYYGLLAIVITILMSLMFAAILYKNSLFHISGRQGMLILIIIVYSVAIYGQYSPVLELRQDPSMYMFKALNLVNYGYIYKPLDTLAELGVRGLTNAGTYSGYAAIQNGTQFANSVLNLDFYPGATFLYAFIGFFYKPIIFYGQTIIMVLNGILMFIALCSIAVKNRMYTNVIYTLTFLTAPLIVWFGRGSFCEPVSLSFFLILFCLLSQVKSPNPAIIALIGLVVTTSITARIDYGLLLLLGVIIITRWNWKAGLIYTAFGITVWIMCSKTYWIYYNRIILDMPVLKFIPHMMAIVFLVSALLFKYLEREVLKIIYSRYIKWVYLAGSVLLLLLMFREHFTVNYETALIHGTDTRTYAEAIWLLLFMVFPFYCLIFGTLGMYQFLDSKRYDISLLFFIFGAFTPYLYLFLRPGNSPMLYWLLRRYYNIIVPMMFISFVVQMDKHWKPKISAFICCFSFVFSVGMLLESEQTVDYKGLDTSVSTVETELKEEEIETIFYTSDMRYVISSLMSYSDMDFVPISYVNIGAFKNYLDENGLQNAVLLSGPLKKVNPVSEHKIYYSKMGETHGTVPKETYEKEYTIYQYNLSEFVEKYSENIIFPNFNNRVTIQGFYNSSIWTSREVDIAFNRDELLSSDKLIIQLTRDTNYYLANSNYEALGLTLIIGPDTTISNYDYIAENREIIFDLSGYRNTELTNIKLLLNTFNPKELGINGDSGDLGIPVAKIYFSD